MKTKQLIVIVLGLWVCAIHANETMTISSPYIEALNNANRGAPVAFLLERGDSFTLLKRKSDWVKVKTQSGQMGWLNLYTLQSNNELQQINKKYRTPWYRKWGLGISSGYFGKEPIYKASAVLLPEELISFQLAYGKIIGDYSSSQMTSAALMLRFFKEQRIKPYLMAEYGTFENKPRNSLVNATIKSENLLGYVLGVDVNAYKRLFVRFSLATYSLLESGDDYTEWRFGLLAPIY